MCQVNSVRINQENDIVCYKVFRKKLFSNKLYSVFQDFTWKVNKVHAIHSYVPNINYHREIYSNAFHSFQSLDGAQELCACKNKESILVFSKYVVYECIIPKNSKFVYSGYTMLKDYTASFASEKLIPIKQVYI